MGDADIPDRALASISTMEMIHKQIERLASQDFFGQGWPIEADDEPLLAD